MPPAPRPRGGGLSPSLQRRVREAAEATRRRLAEEMEAEPPFPVDPPEPEPEPGQWTAHNNRLYYTTTNGQTGSFPLLTDDSDREDTD